MSGAKRHQIITALVILAVLAGGIAVRVVVKDSDGLTAMLSNVLPWLNKTPVTFYYTDISGEWFVPVSRQLSDEDAAPRAVIEALLQAPDGLASAVPRETKIQHVALENETIRVDLSSEFLQAENPQQAQLALVATLRSLPNVERVIVTVETIPQEEIPAQFVYFTQDTMLVALPIYAGSPRDALDAYLSGSPDSAAVGLPPDVQLLTYDYRPQNGLLKLGFSYTPSLRRYAIDDPDGMRQVLIGLIATMTQFPEIKAVQLDFEGHSQLGLGQCANLLRAPQTQPEILNDERLF